MINYYGYLINSFYNERSGRFKAVITYKGALIIVTTGDTEADVLLACFIHVYELVNNAKPAPSRIYKTFKTLAGYAYN